MIFSKAHFFYWWWVKVFSPTRALSASKHCLLKQFTGFTSALPGHSGLLRCPWMPQNACFHLLYCSACNSLSYTAIPAASDSSCCGSNEEVEREWWGTRGRVWTTCLVSSPSLSLSAWVTLGRSTWERVWSSDTWFSSIKSTRKAPEDLVLGNGNHIVVKRTSIFTKIRSD